MVIGRNRDKFQFLLEGPAKLCVKLHISPNQISFFAFLSSIFGAACFAFPNIFMFNYIPSFLGFDWLYFWWGWVPVFFFGLGAYLDALDGTVARKADQTSAFGGFLDSTLDRLSDGAIILGLVLGQMLWPWSDPTFRINAVIGLITLIIVLLISYVRSRAEVEAVPMQGVGFMERPERILYLVLSYLVSWVIYCIQTQYFNGWTLSWIFPAFFALFLILCLLTLIHRVYHVFHWFEKHSSIKAS